MKSLALFLVCLFTLTIVQAQTIADFENFNLAVGSFDNDAGDSGFFESGNVLLPNEYFDDPNFPYWNGWSISSMIDNTTPGFGNQYSCIAGQGAEGSDSYALGYVFGSLELNLKDDAKGGIVNGLYLNNSTYAYLSMLEGDGFAKKFGGENGNDPDFFKLTIRKRLNGVMGTDSVEFYLADYRSGNNSEDYIVNEWKWLDLSSLGPVDELVFTMASSDVGAFGINTPTYFCMDNLITADSPSANRGRLEPKIAIWPNPAVNKLMIDWPVENTNGLITDVSGVVIKNFALTQGQNRVDISDIAPGIFILHAISQATPVSQVFIKN